MIRRWAFATVALWAFVAAPASAQVPIVVETHRQDIDHNPFTFLKLLGADDDHPLQSANLEESAPATVRSHVRVRYVSGAPVPVRIVFPWDPAADHQLTAVLPPSTAGDVLLPLTASPAWRSGMPPLTIEVYWIDGTEVGIADMATENRLSVLGRWLTYLRQPFMPEYFSSFSLGTIYGYAIGGRSLAFAAGVAALVSIAVWYVAARGKKSLLSVALAVWVPFLLLYETRFLADIAAATVVDQARWYADGSYNDMRHLYNEADLLLRLNGDAGGGLSVASCTGLATPLRYFVYPMPVEDWSDADVGVTQGVWNDDRASFSCAGVARAGAVVRRFPDGEAVVRFTNTP